MNKHSSTFESEVVANVRRLTEDSKSGVDLFRLMDGVHPIEIKRVLLACEEHRLLKFVFAGLETVGPSLREVKRDDNPVLSFWPFTSDCARRIASLAKDYGSIALLGAPTVFSALREAQKDNVILFDRDDYFFRGKSTDGYVQCDLLSDALLSFRNKFDLVIGDPPWYFDEYISWLNAAICLTRPGGTVVFVLYPQNIRETAFSERKEILRALGNLLDDVRSVPLTAEYETPSFEQVEFIQNGIYPMDWRRAEFISGKVPVHKIDCPVEAGRSQRNLWTERRIGCGRIFIDDVPSDNSPFLQTAHPNHRFLLSPSRRDPSRKKANVLSSRGHGLSCNDPKRLIDLISDIQVGCDIEKIGGRLDKSSGKLFQLVANDLWGRFIAL
jgi:hypothetical protein